MKTPRNVSLAMVVSNSIPAAFVETTVKGSPLSEYYNNIFKFRK